ncbi:unnamed protein product [Calicophoron daubneyi]|uniref:NAD(P)-binding domain-containing protein n=1 Tax=Calicophoron daubneyi TaxID=300641 RepID=A0AAV2T0D1_CALDB
MSVALRAFVVGYTGETGKALVKVLAKDNRYGSVKLIGRRNAEIDYGIEKSEAEKKFSQHVIDFSKLNDYSTVFEESDVGFCALGTTLRKSGAEQMRVIDHDYVIRIAELALETGCKEFHLVTSKAANPQSHIFYLRLKGEIEEDLKTACIFPNYVAFYRPGTLMCNRTERRFMESVVKTLLKPVAALSPTWITTPVTVLAQAMANAPFCLASCMRRRAIEKGPGDLDDSRVFVVENDLIFDLAAKTDDNQEQATESQ